MSQDEGLHDTKDPQGSDETASFLPSYLSSSSIFQSTGCSNAGFENSRYDICLFLAVAQRLNIDFLPITWQPALECLGTGATGNVNQSLINVQLALAFKRVHVHELHGKGHRLQEYYYKALVTEIAVLGDPAIREHENIIRLEGICWELSCFDEAVWPVLVLEKAPLGDLKYFMSSDKGRSSRFSDKLKLCLDIARGVSALHARRE